MENKIYWEKFKKEYLPLRDGKGKETYLFRNQLQKLETLLKSAERVEKINESNVSFNKVIGISGERGSGKSSLLWSFRDTIIHNDADKFKEYYVLEPIDPNYLDKNMGLLEIILTTLYNDVEEYVKRGAQGRQICDLQAAKQVKQKILRQIELQRNIRHNQGFSNKVTPSELIEEYKSRIDFEEEYHKLFKDCWSLLKGEHCDKYKKGFLVILVDDIDVVDNDLIYQMLEDIKMVLSENVTTVLTYRKVQLESSLYNTKIEENRELINNFSIVDRDEIIKQGDTYLEKLISKNNIVEMKTQYNILNLKMKELFVDVADRNYLSVKGFDLEKSVRYNIYAYISEHILLNIESSDYREIESFEASFNLRSILQLLENVIENFKDLHQENNYFEPVIHNTEIFKSYLLMKSADLLDKRDRKILENWMQAEVKSKNHVLYAEFFNLMCERVNSRFCDNGTAKDVLEVLLDIKKVQYYNVCLGDVIEIMEYEKYLRMDATLIYYFKIFYSIELLQSLVIEIFDKKSRENLELKIDLNNEFRSTNYFNLTRYKILPMSKYVFPLPVHVANYLKLESDRTLLFKMLYTNLASSGDRYLGARKTVNKNPERLIDYKYRHVFDIEGIEKMDGIRGQVNVDPFSVLVKPEYVEGVIDGKYEYIFYSLFDIDHILALPTNHKKNSKEPKEARLYLTTVNTAIKHFREDGVTRFPDGFMRFESERLESIYTEEEEVDSRKLILAKPREENEESKDIVEQVTLFDAEE